MHMWYVTQRGGEPVGPVSEDTLTRGLKAGRVPSDVLICKVGGDRWLTLDEVSQFAALIAAPSQGVPLVANSQARSSIEPPTVTQMEPLFWDAAEEGAASSAGGFAALDGPTQTSLNPPTDPGEELVTQSEERTIVEGTSYPASGRSS